MSTLVQLRAVELIIIVTCFLFPTSNWIWIEAAKSEMKFQKLGFVFNYSS